MKKRVREEQEFDEVVTKFVEAHGLLFYLP